MNLSDYLKNAVLDHLLGGPDFVRPATVYVGLSYADPLSDGSGISEPAVNGYGRASFTNDGTVWAAAAAGSKPTIAEILFPTATGSWGAALTHYFLIDNDPGGNLLFFGELSTPRLVTIGGQPRLQAGTLVVTAS